MAKGTPTGNGRKKRRRSNQETEQDTTPSRLRIVAVKVLRGGKVQITIEVPQKVLAEMLIEKFK